MPKVSNGIINNSKYDFLNLIFVFLKIIAVKNNATGNIHVPIYMKFSKCIGSISKNVVHISWDITPIQIIRTLPNTEAKAFCNWDNGLFPNILHNSNIIENVDINNNINYRFKRSYAIYKGLLPNKSPRTLLNLKLSDISYLLNINSNSIHDLQSLKIIVQNLEECYYSLELLQKNYETIPGKVKDCIMNPKTNGYQSLHTTILDNDYDQLQTQIRTVSMDKRDSLGIAFHWQEGQTEASFYMKQELYDKFPFFQNLIEIDNFIKNDKEFVEQAKKEVLSEMIYPHNKNGKIIELPSGATIMDFACHELTDINTKIIAIVNGKIVPLNYVLKSKDNVDLIQILNQQQETISCDVVTTKAKQRLKKIYG